ncbi:DUF2889 family protein [Alkalispirillum mobile]|uniref:DUF2889 family protein n=1 Tax=Alkalispirillum mobile TaxID=85925 RepID=A0A498CA63_9GAMM|nr:DUF2889 domain-containing protein [Alkalispirillum mobile]RLK51366.1 DUF2889 family protein [Alkalispirillum mobile]
MPLSPAADRTPIHRRQIECNGYRRDDGLWDIEAHLLDTRGYSFPNRWRPGGRIAAGDPLHQMALRLTVDDQLVIRDVEAAVDASPFPECAEVRARFRDLIGVRIGPGWRRSINRVVGGVKGCTHLVELLGPMATVAYQTLGTTRRPSADEEGAPRPPQLNTCHGWRESGEAVQVLYPRHFRPTDSDD